MAERTLLRAARVLDPRRGVAFAGGVLVEGATIAALLERPDELEQAARDARVVELGECTLLPGLIDLHTHLTAWANAWAGPTDLTTRYALQAAANLSAALDRGVTTIRDVGTHGDVAIAARDAVAAGVLAGPRVLACRNPVSITGAIGSAEETAHLGPTSGWVAEADGPDALRAAVREQVNRGADWIKLYYEKGDWTRAELTAAVDAAHALGVRVACHAVRSHAIKEAIAAGVDTVEHGLQADDDDLRAMAERGIGWIPTLLIVADRIGAAAGGDSSVDAALHDAQLRAFRANLAIGAPVGAGVDPIPGLGAIPFAAVAQELALMVELGMEPLAALRTATSGAAELLRLGDELGTLQPGAAADLIALDGDPLADVGALGRVRLVLRAGTVVRDARFRHDDNDAVDA